MAALVVGKPARRLATEIAAVQEVLGEHQDACVAREWLRRAVPQVDSEAAYVAGRLATMQDVEASDRREEFSAAWRKAKNPKLRGWLPT